MLFLGVDFETSRYLENMTGELWTWNTQVSVERRQRTGNSPSLYKISELEGRSSSVHTDCLGGCFETMRAVSIISHIYPRASRKASHH